MAPVDVRNIVTVTAIYRSLGMIGLGAGLLAAGRAQGEDVAKDPRLQKPMSITLKIAGLPSALKAISKVDGVPLANVSTIDDLKVTVLVHKVPAGAVLAGIASVLGCEWKADGNLLRLVMDPEEKVRRDRYVTSEEDAGRKEIEDELNGMAQMSSMTQEQIATELRSQGSGFGTSLGSSGASGSTASPATPDQVRLLRLMQTPQNLELGRFLSNLSGAQVTAFWRGDVIAGEPAPLTADAQPESAAVATGGAQTQFPRVPRRPTGLPIFVQFDPLLYQLHVASGGGQRVISVKPSTSLVLNYAPPATSAFGKEVLAWDQPVPTDGDWAKTPLGGSIGSAVSATARAALGDMLFQTFEQTGAPVVADAFRAPMLVSNLSRGSSTLGSWFSALKTDDHVFTRFENGIALVRHGGFWRLRKFETPEETLAPLEVKADKGTPTLDDYAAFVAKLTPEQAKPFCIPGGTVTMFSTRPIEMAYPALVFYGSLSSAEVEAATDSGIPAGRLDAGQIQLFDAAALESVFFGAAASGFDRDLVRLANEAERRGLGFLMRKQQMPVGGQMGDGQALFFGANLNQAAIYRIPLTR